MSDVKFTEVGGNLGAAIAQALGASTKAPEFKPATMVQIRDLMEGNAQPKFQLGDIVQLRETFKNNYRYPKAEDKAIVTQVLDQPYRSGSGSNPEAAFRKDIALAFRDESDGEILECLYDSRQFVKVGSIYDPIDLPNGEKVPVV